LTFHQAYANIRGTDKQTKTVTQDTKMKDAILNSFYTYEVGEFLPIFEGHELQNKRQFAFYKAKHIAKGLGKQLHKTANK
jgi:hypothetical protein